MIDLTAASRRSRALGYGLLVGLAYIPILLTDRGQVAADTKQYLYLDPGGLLSRASSMWDPNVGLGTVTHQTIGYLFPMGPYYWIMDTVGFPDWVAQRIWLGSILLAAGAGVLFLARTFDLRGPGAVVAALVYMLSPYSLHYSARISVILLPWAALPWMVALVARGLRRGGWRHAAIFALVVQVVGGVNATALVFAGILPVLFVPFAIWVSREVSLRRALATLARFGVLTVTASLWWMSGLWAQGSYGIDILGYTETVRTVARTSIAPEVLRGLGYWFFYGRDKLGPWIEANTDYTQVIGNILISYALPVLALLGACCIRWRYRAFFVVCIVVGTAIAVGVYPYDDPAPFGALLKAFADSSQAGLALRSTGRAIPLVVLGLAMLLGAGVTALWAWCRARGLDRVSYAVVGIVVALAVFNLPALWNGHFYGANLQRPENVPEYWSDAAAVLGTRPTDTRVLEIPGSDFASYQWGNTVDPITPGLVDRPHIARELIPHGSDPSADLINAFDRRLQDGVLDRGSIAPVARVMAVGDVLIRNDLQFERFNTPRPTLLWPSFWPAPPPGLGVATRFGAVIPEGPSFFPFVDEQELALAPDTPSGPPVAILEVADARPIVRIQPRALPLVLAGNGDGLVDAAGIGVVNNESVILYSATYADDPEALLAEIDQAATLVVTDTNRKRAIRWSTARDTVGYTERADESPLVDDPSDARLQPFGGADSDTQTVVEQRGAIVEATAYGNPVSYTPEDRAARALDGDLTTAWKVGAFDEVVGEKIRIETPDSVTTDQVNLVQVLDGPRERYIERTTLRFDGDDAITVDLDEASRTPEGQTIVFPERTFRELEIEIEETNFPPIIEYIGVSPVGFAAIRYGDRDAASEVRVEEVVRMPVDLLEAAGQDSIDHPLVLVMTRQRVPPVPPRSDEESFLARSFGLPTPRSFGVTGVARLAPAAAERTLDALLGVAAVEEGGVRVESSDRLPGDVNSRAASAIDRDPETAWRSPFENPEGQWLRTEVPEPVTFDRLDLRVVADGRHSVPTRLHIAVDDGDPVVVDLPEVDDGEPGHVAEVPVTFEPMTGSTITVVIAGVRPVTTIEYHSVAPITTPVGVAELGIPGVELVTEPGSTMDTGCRDDLLTVDGVGVPIRIVGDREIAAARGELDVVACTDVALADGTSTVRSVHGRETGLDIDRLVLTSQAGGAPGETLPLGRVPEPASAPSPGVLDVEELGRTTVRAVVRDAEEPFWFVLGESLNAGWRLEVDGEDLGTGTLVNGYANGWPIDPAGSGELAITARWTPQRVVDAALVVSGLAALGCLAIALASWRRARLPAAATAPATFGVPWGGGDRPLGSSVRVLVAGAIVPGLLAAFLIRPWVGLLVGGVSAAVLRWDRLRPVFGLAPAALLGLAALYIAGQQYRVRYPPFFEWPTFFDRVHILGWLAVAFLAAGAWFEILRRWRDRSRL